MCSIVLTLGHISDFSRHVPDLVTLIVQWGRWPAKRKVKKCKGTISSGDVVKVTGEPIRIKSQGRWLERVGIQTRDLWGEKEPARPRWMNNVCEGQVLGGAWQMLEASSGGLNGEQGSIRYGQTISGLVGSGKGGGAMGSYWGRILSGTLQRGGDMLQFLIMKDAFSLCVESALGGESSEQKQGDL